MSTAVATERPRPAQQLPAIRPPRLPYHPLIQERFGIDVASWKALVEAVFPTATSVESVILALSYCRARKLDPFKKNVHIVPIWNKDLGCYVDTIWPGIGELRTTAFRTGEYAGRDATEFGPDLKQKVGSIEMTFPEWAQVTVYRIMRGQRVGFAGPRVYWLETYATIKRNDDTPNDMWRDRPRGQIDKCFDSETEVLTDQGFQPFGFVTGRVMQVTDQGLEPTDAVPFSQRYDGPMICCDGNALNFCVTPNHDMVTTNGKVEASKVFSESTSSAGHTIPLTVLKSADELPVTDKEIALAAAIVCDGHRSGAGFSVGVSRPRKVAELVELGMHESSHVRHCEGDTAVAGTRVIRTKADKTVFRYGRKAAGVLIGDDSGHLNLEAIRHLSRRQARVLVDAMLRFDGSQSKTARRFYCSDQQTLGAFEVAACIAGYAIGPRKGRQSDIGGINWSITVSSKEQVKTFRTSSSQSRLKGGLYEAPNADGFVWCCTVPSGVIVVRRKGLSMLCGNCAEAAALRAAFPEEMGQEHIPEEVQHGTKSDVIEGKVNSTKPALEALTDQMTGESDKPDLEPGETMDEQGEIHGSSESPEPSTTDQPGASGGDEPEPPESYRVCLGIVAGKTQLGAVDQIEKEAIEQYGEEWNFVLVEAFKCACEARRAAIRAGRGQRSNGTQKTAFDTTPNAQEA